MKEEIAIPGLGRVSRHKACQIAICEEAGCEELFTPARLTLAADLRQFTDKEIRNALDALVRAGQVQRVGVGSYQWKA